MSPFEEARLRATINENIERLLGNKWDPNNKSLWLNRGTPSRPAGEVPPFPGPRPVGTCTDSKDHRHFASLHSRDCPWCLQKLLRGERHIYMTAKYSGRPKL